MILVADRASYGFLGRLWKKGDQVEVAKGTNFPHHFHVLVPDAPDPEPVKAPPAVEAPAETPVKNSKPKPGKK